MQLGLGSAQFGLNYGISNSNGKVDIDCIRLILNYAENKNISLVDTAVAYGNAHQQLSKANAFNRFHIVTKLTISPEIIDFGIVNHVKNLLNEASTDFFYAILIHNPQILLNKSYSKEIWSALRTCQESNLVTKLGVSVYCPKMLKTIIHTFDIDIVQFPLNILDQRFMSLEMKRLYREKSIETHARSIFLQGLLLLPPQQWKGQFGSYMDPLLHFFNFAMQKNMTPFDLCLEYAKNQSSLDYLIIGVTNLVELSSILKKIHQKPIRFDYSQFSYDDENLINPSLWEVEK